MIILLQLCLLGKFLLTMRPQKYVFDHCNYSMGSHGIGAKLETKHVNKLSLEK